MSKPRFQLSRIKPASIPFMAEETYQTLKYAPGNQPELPPRQPERPSRRNMKLELADAEVDRCVYCGTWHNNLPKKLCNWCSKNPFPTIDDIERTA